MNYYLSFSAFVSLASLASSLFILTHFAHVPFSSFLPSFLFPFFSSFLPFSVKARMAAKENGEEIVFGKSYSTAASTWAKPAVGAVPSRGAVDDDDDDDE